MLQNKAGDELQALTNAWGIPDEIAETFGKLIDLHGDESVLDEAESCLTPLGNEALRCIEDLRRLTVLIRDRIGQGHLHFDLAELRSYRYHTGIIFAAYHPVQNRVLAYGGRYDHIGQDFGRARPAIGFSADLKVLVGLAPSRPSTPNAIFAPGIGEPELWREIERLRAQGNVVICQLPGQRGAARETGCNRELCREGDTWKLVPVKTE